MRAFFSSLVLFGGILLIAPSQAAAQCNACEDANDDGICQAGEVIADNLWLGGNAFATTVPFVVPDTCVVNVAGFPPPLRGVEVTATKVTIGAAQIVNTASGGEGMLFIADSTLGVVGDGSITADGATILTGGINKLSTTIPAVPKSSLAFWSVDDGCQFFNTQFTGEPVLGSGQIGVNCLNDITIKGSTWTAAGMDIQSLTGQIDAGATSAGGAPIIGLQCDDPVLNLVNGNAPPGNNDGALTLADDFPCQILFNNQPEIIDFCGGMVQVQDPNVFIALNNPLVMIAQQDLLLGGTMTANNEVGGRFHVFLVSVLGDVHTEFAEINNTMPAPGGATISVAASPAVVNRTPLLKEKFTGPCFGDIFIEQACYESPNPIMYCGTLVGTPAPPPCSQLGDFNAVLSGKAG